MPGEFFAVVMFGNGMAGISMNMLRAILNLIFPDQDQSFNMCLIFGFISGSILVFAGVIYGPMFSNPFFLYYLNKSKGGNQDAIEDNNANLETGGETDH